MRQFLIKSRVASFYEKVFGLPLLGRRIRSSAVVRMLDSPPGGRQKLLDAGCSWGILIFELYRGGGLQFFEFFGLDLSIEALKDAQKLARTVRAQAFHPVAADVRFLPFRDESFDKVVCAEVLEHISDDRMAMGELRRTLRRYGKLVVTVPNANQKISWVSSSSKELFEHVREGYSLQQLRLLVESQGLHVLQTRHVGNLFGSAAWEVSFRFLHPLEPFRAHFVLEALSFPILYGIANLDSFSGERVWSKWLVLEASKTLGEEGNH